MSTNLIYRLVQSLPTNGYTTAIGAVASLLYGIGGLVMGLLNPGSGIEMQAALGFIIAGITALGIGSKQDKISNAVAETPPIAG